MPSPGLWKKEQLSADEEAAFERNRIYQAKIEEHIGNGTYFRSLNAASPIETYNMLLALQGLEERIEKLEKKK